MSVLPIAILTGGFGTRLGSLTKALPKSMVAVNGEPFIAHVLRLLYKKGLREVVLCVGHLGQCIQDFVGDGTAFGLSVCYSNDGEVPLGTAGAIRRAMPLLGHNFFVLYGDSYLQCDYRSIGEAFLQSHQPAMMTVFKNRDSFEKSNVVFREGKIIAYDKVSRTHDMHHVDYGLGVFNASVFDETPADLANVYQRLLLQNKLAGYEVPQRFYEMGSVSGLDELANYLALQGGETV